MVDQASQMIDEIKQIKAQYVAEVGKGRRAWPRSIKDRAAKLDEIGVPAKDLAGQTGIPYETLLSWRYNRRQMAGRFHEVKVATKRNLPATTSEPNAKTILKSGTVTVPTFEMPATASVQIARLTTPNGFVVEGLDAAGAAWLIGALSRAGGGHAS